MSNGKGRTPDQELLNRLVKALLRVPGVEESSMRTVMLTGINVHLNRSNHAFVELTSILTQLEGLGRLRNGERPIVIVARNARLAVGDTELGRELESLAQEIEKAYSEEPLMADIPTQPEALIFGGSGE